MFNRCNRNRGQDRYSNLESMETFILKAKRRFKITITKLELSIGTFGSIQNFINAYDKKYIEMLMCVSFAFTHKPLNQC